jgi:hypothetical protein
MARVALYALLGVVATAAAALSFFALRDLALLCGFHPRMAPLLPIVVDAGAAAETLVWLARWAPVPARRFARVLALTLLGSSVAANALGHGLAAYGLRPHWLAVARRPQKWEHSMTTSEMSRPTTTRWCSSTRRSSGRPSTPRCWRPGMPTVARSSRPTSVTPTSANAR